MTKRIILSLAMIALTIAGVTSATVAYFSDTAVSHGNTFSMGTVEVTQEQGWGLPFMFTDMVPGEQRESGIITIRNTGSMPIDLYVGEKATSGTADFRTFVDYAINEISCWEGNYLRTWVNWQDIGLLFSTWNKVGENIPASDYKCYKVYVKPDASMDDGLQGKSAVTDVIIYAVQHGQPHPAVAPDAYVYPQ